MKTFKVTLGNYAEEGKKRGGIFRCTYFRLIRKINYEERWNFESSFGICLSCSSGLDQTKKWVYLLKCTVLSFPSLKCIYYYY